MNLGMKQIFLLIAIGCFLICALGRFSAWRTDSLAEIGLAFFAAAVLAGP